MLYRFYLLRTKGRINSSMKVDKKLHDKMVRYKKQGLISQEVSLVDFTNAAIRTKLGEIRNEQVQDMLTTKLEEIQDNVLKLISKGRKIKRKK